MNTSDRQFDVVVIGSGPGGEGAAMQLAKSGRKVIMIEKHDSIGGGCTHWGTIPSKALRHSVSRLIEYNTNPLFAAERIHRGLTFAEILKHAQGVISKQIRLRSSFYDRNGVTVIHGTAQFATANRLQITQTDGTTEYITTKQVVIATGSRPYHPADVDFKHPRIYDSDTLLDLKHEPRSIIIYGVGVVGCEYASIFRGLGVKVDLVNTRGRLLSFLDAEISDALSYHLRNSGVIIRHNDAYTRVEPQADQVVLHLVSGK